jgi:molybdenum cofactor cytidylyltransferase
MSEPFVAGLVLAAGGSRTLGRPKPLLPYNGGTLLDHALTTARACEFDQLLVTVGSKIEKVRARVNLSGTEVVPNLTAALAALDPAATSLVLLLGDQPGVVPGTVRVLLAAGGDAPIAVCRYDDGRGYPLALARELFDDLRALPGEKAIWRLLGRHEAAVTEVPVAGRVPPEVDSWADYEEVVAAAGHGPTPELSSRDAGRAVPIRGWRRGLRG